MAKVCITAENVSNLDGGKCVCLLQEAGLEVCEITGDSKLEREALTVALAGCDAVMAGMERYDAALLSCLPGLKLIARRGAGTDNVDLAAASARGVRVANTPRVTNAAVAELTMGFLLAFARKIPVHDAAMKRGEWTRILSDGLMGQTIGLFGFGGIAREVAKRARAFGMRVLCYYRRRDPEAEQAFDAEYVSFDKLLRESDYLSVHTPLTELTRGRFTMAEFGRMKSTAVFVNTARGAIANQHDLAAALNDGVIRGAAVDVYDAEPCTGSPLMGCENVILTPHVGSFTRQTFEAMNRMCVENILDFLRRGTCGNLVN